MEPQEAVVAGSSESQILVVRRNGNCGIQKCKRQSKYVN